MAHLRFAREFLVAFAILAGIARAQFNCPLCSCGPRETLQLLVEAGTDGCPACTCVPGAGDQVIAGGGPNFVGGLPAPQPQPIAGGGPRPDFPEQPPPSFAPPPPLAGAKTMPVFPQPLQPAFVAPQPTVSGDGPPGALTATVRQSYSVHILF